jgi:hypothetical protein
VVGARAAAARAFAGGRCGDGWEGGSDEVAEAGVGNHPAVPQRAAGLWVRAADGEARGGSKSGQSAWGYIRNRVTAMFGQMGRMGWGGEGAGRELKRECAGVCRRAGESEGRDAPKGQAQETGRNRKHEEFRRFASEKRTHGWPAMLLSGSVGMIVQFHRGPSGLSLFPAMGST